MQARDITGERYGRLVALRFSHRVGPRSRTRAIWAFRCDCGCEFYTRRENVLYGKTKSCGCLHAEIIRTQGITHGASVGGKVQKLYRVWTTMKARCQNPSNPRYKDYGARGIYICDRWQSFENFSADVGEKPSPIHSIDRIDNDGPYSPDNFRWATPLEQRRNQRRCLNKAPRGERANP